MEYNNERNTWIRICPQCKQSVEHHGKSSRAKCSGAERLKNLCVGCSRSNIGKKNAKLALCPICQQPFSCAGGLENHAATHELTGEALWCRASGNNIPLCKCGCGGIPSFRGWTVGWAEFVLGHNASIHSGAYTQEEAQAIIDQRNKSLATNPDSWLNYWRGKTKESDDQVRARGVATGLGLQKAYDSGELVCKTKGQTKETNASVRQTSNTMTRLYAEGVLVPDMKGENKHNSEKVRKMAANVSRVLSERSIRKMLDEKKRLPIAEITHRIESSGRLKLIGIVDEYINDLVSLIEVKCNTCGRESRRNLRYLQRGRCEHCEPVGSIAQHEIADFIESLNLRVIRNDRQVIKPKELDIWIPEKSIGIEYNGLYWHNEKKIARLAHDNKSIECKSVGIQLLHVFEDEWLEKPEVIKSMLRHKLGVTPRRIGARQCIIKPISSQVSTTFFEANHLDGDVHVKRQSWGMFYGKELISAINVRKPFQRSSSTHLEIARFATVLNTSIPGALSRFMRIIIAYCHKHSLGSRIMTYVDTRSGNGRGYEIAGFSLVGYTPPRFWWLHEASGTRFNRHKYRADLKNRQTERQIAEEAGVVKIWGCSNMKYELVF